MSKPKVDCDNEIKKQDLELYMHDVAQATETMKRFVHKMKKIRSNLLGHHKPNCGRA